MQTRGHGCPRFCEKGMFPQTKPQMAYYINKGQQLLNPYNDMIHFETCA